MKRTLLLILVALLPILANAYDAEIDGIYYNFSGGEATVTYEIAHYSSSNYSGSIIIPKTVTNNGIVYSVTSIDNLAFEGCTGLTSITIPNSLTSIGNYAFSGCTSLTSIAVESGNTKYDSRNNCNAIIETATNTLISGCKNTTIPNSVTSIGAGAFYGCSNLTSITIPNSVISIGYRAFGGCSGLTFITIPNSVTTIEDEAFDDCI